METYRLFHGNPKRHGTKFVVGQHEFSEEAHLTSILKEQ